MPVERAEAAKGVRAGAATVCVAAGWQPAGTTYRLFLLLVAQVFNLRQGKPLPRPRARPSRPLPAPRALPLLLRGRKSLPLRSAALEFPGRKKLR